MQLYNHTLLIVVKSGTFLVKLNHNDYKSFKIDALRIIMDMGNEVNAQIALNSLGWETLKVQRTKAKAKLMFKILNMSGPKSLTDLFTYKNENTHYCLRDNEITLVLQQPRTNSMKKSFMFN